MFMNNAGAAFAQGVFDALGKRPFSIQGPCRVHQAEIYACGYLYVCPDDSRALSFMDASWQEYLESFDIEHEKREMVLP